MNQNFYTPFVKVFMTFQGRPLTKEFAQKHPEVMGFYPPHHLFMNLYLQLRNLVLHGFSQTLEVDEFCVKVNGKVVMYRIN